MPEIDQPQLANLVQETRQRLNRSQTKFAAKLGGSCESINRWGNGQTKLLPTELKQIEHLLCQMGEASQDLLVVYFPE